MEKITSPRNPRIKRAIKLHQSRGRQTQNRMIIFGEREVFRAIQRGIPFEELFINDDYDAAKLERCLDSTHLARPEILQLTNQVFAKVQYGVRNDGIVGIGPRPSIELGRLPDPGQRTIVLVAEAIEKPGNIGAIARTADAVGVFALIFSNPICDPFHPNAIRSSTGAVFGLPMAKCSNQACIGWLEEHEFQILVATPDDANNFYDVVVSDRVAIVVGNEANGISDEWINPKYERVRLPMIGRVDSLNVSVTASVLLYEARRKLGFQKI